MEKAELNKQIGKRLKEIRKQKELSLDRTAELTGVSKPMLGQIERGETNPTVGTLWKIANGLTVAFTTFLESDRPAVTHISYEELETLEGDHGSLHVKPVFTKNHYTPFEVFYIEIDSCEEYCSKAHQHGVEEFLFLKEGNIEVVVGDSRFFMKKGDALRFEGDKDHIYRNIGGKIASLMMIIYYSRN